VDLKGSPNIYPTSSAKSKSPSSRRDSVAAFFSNDGDADSDQGGSPTPKSPFEKPTSLRKSTLSPGIPSVHGSGQRRRSIAPSPLSRSSVLTVALQDSPVRPLRRPRDSIAHFFNDSDLIDEEDEGEPEESNNSNASMSMSFEDDSMSMDIEDGSTTMPHTEKTLSALELKQLMASQQAVTPEAGEEEKPVDVVDMSASVVSEKIPVDVTGKPKVNKICCFKLLEFR
jgi:hypothetical protein